MSLITRCPACTTMFKVVPDQLRISDGWVRCGQCDEVFDANSHLQSDVQVQGSAQGSINLRFQNSDQSSLGASVSTESVETIDRVDEDEQADWQDLASASAEPVATAATLHSEITSTAEIPETDAFLEMNPLDRSRADASEEPYELPPLLSFMPVPEKASVWASGPMRVVLTFLCGLAGILLAAQVLVQERDRIAASQPAARPLLANLCEFLGCSISPLRQIESVAIDSSSFTKVRTDVYRLNFTLKNAALVSVEVPALELTLTDMQDQPVARRVIQVAEFGVNESVLPSSAEVAVSMTISLKLQGNSERVSGYRLLAFYP